MAACVRSTARRTRQAFGPADGTPTTTFTIAARVAMILRATTLRPARGRALPTALSGTAGLMAVAMRADIAISTRFATTPVGAVRPTARSVIAATTVVAVRAVRVLVATLATSGPARAVAPRTASARNAVTTAAAVRAVCAPSTRHAPRSGCASVAVVPWIALAGIAATTVVAVHAACARTGIPATTVLAPWAGDAFRRATACSAGRTVAAAHAASAWTISFARVAFASRCLHVPSSAPTRRAATMAAAASAARAASMRHARVRNAWMPSRARYCARAANAEPMLSLIHI